MKTFLDMTKEEAEFIVKRLYQTKHKEKIVEIIRYDNCIEVTMEAIIEEDDGEVWRYADDDRFELHENKIVVCDFGISKEQENENNILYNQYLFAKGYHWINQDNEFMEER